MNFKLWNVIVSHCIEFHLIMKTFLFDWHSIYSHKKRTNASEYEYSGIRMTKKQMILNQKKKTTQQASR